MNLKTKTSSSEYDTWRDTLRHASYGLGCLLILYKGSLPQIAHEDAAAESNLYDYCEDLLESKGEAAVHSYSAVTPEEALQLIYLCIDAITDVNPRRQQ